MKKRKLFYILACIIFALILGLMLVKPQINRLFDNRDGAVMGRHDLLLENKIQSLARQNNTYPTPIQAQEIITDSGFINPHTHKSYVFIGPTSNIAQISDGQIAYGLGDIENPNPRNDKAAYMCIGIGMPRTHEGGSSCDTLKLDKNTDVRLQYYLSCKINWLGFSTNCNKSLLQSL